MWARVAISRHWMRDRGLWVDRGDRGTVTQFAFRPNKDEFLVGVYWDDPRPLIPRRDACPIDWYTENEFHGLLKVAPAKAGVEKAA